MDIRERLGLVSIEHMTPSALLLRIAMDQARRLELRQAAQRSMSKPKKEKPKREPKPSKRTRRSDRVLPGKKSRRKRGEPNGNQVDAVQLS